MKPLGFVVSDKKIFENCILKTYFLTPWPTYMQPIRTIWTILVGDHPGTIPVEFGQINISGSREDVVWTFPYIIQCKLWPLGQGQFWPQGHNLNNFGRGPLDDAIYQILKPLGLVVSDKKIFENCILKTYFLTPWPTYATNQNNLNNFGRGPQSDHSCWDWSNYQ